MPNDHGMSTVDPISGIRLVGEPGSYAGGSEERVLEVLEHAGDRSTTSDELARHITDRPSRYHLSRLRANLLRPLRIGRGLRVLDVGAGTGALARYVGETGAEVVALEGSLLRARAAAARCDGLASVEVVCGTLDEFHDADGFDIVLCIGVLEYAEDEAPAFLARLRGFLRPSGALVLAMENQLGLKYLLGYGEGQVGAPWAGIEGYSGVRHVRTYSRRTLSSMLTAAGLRAQKWLFPFPDYRLAAVVLDEDIYEEECAVDAVDQLVRWPCTDDAGAPQRLCDDRRAHRVFLEAGLGPDVANSFFVVASDDTTTPVRLVDPSTTAWLYGGDRMAVWLRGRALGRSGEAQTVSPVPLSPVAQLAERGWLRQQLVQGPRVVGRTIEQLALDACAEGVEQVAEVLRRWRNHLRLLEVEKQEDDGSSHPFRPPEAARLLPADHLDVGLANFVVDDNGEVHYIDREWRASTAVDADLVCLRALWWFARDLVVRGVAHPWPISATVDELTESLALVCEVPCSSDRFEVWRLGEARLQEKVNGRTQEEALREITSTGRMSQVSPAVSVRLPFTVLRRQLAGAAERIAAMQLEAEAERERFDADRQRAADQLRGAHAAAEERTTRLEEELTASREAHTAVERQLHEAQEQSKELEAALLLAEGQRVSLERDLEEGRQAVARLAALEKRFVFRAVRAVGRGLRRLQPRDS